MNQERDIYEQPNKLTNVEMSSIRTIMDKVTNLKQQGKDVISFSVGKPDFNTPEDIKNATIQAIKDNQTHYSSNRGQIELRKAIAVKIKEDTGIEYNPENEILVTCSGAEAINNAILGTVDKGDEVILFTPSFINYKNLIYESGANIVYLPLKEEDNFQVNKEELEARINEHTKLIVMNNPCNPSGIIFNDSSLKLIADAAIKHNLIVFTDEIYSSLVYDEINFHSIAALPGMRERTILMNGFSKTYAMTGWRVGYLAMDRRFMSNLLRIHQYETTTGVTFIQNGLAKTMNSVSVKQDVENMRHELESRRNLVMEELNAIPVFSYVRPQGAFYFLINIEKTGMTGEEFAEKLLENSYVAVVPASSFGKEYANYIRISYSTSKDIICEGFRRIKEFLNIE